MEFAVDWSKFDGPPSQTCYCRCGGVYRSHAKTTRLGESLTIVSKDPCPDCGSHTDLRKVEGDPERWAVRE